MKVTIVMVESADGRITRGTSSGTGGWGSQEDHDSFRELIGKSDSLIMGSTTYRVARDNIQPNPEKLRVVMTRNPEQFAEDATMPGMRFTAESPKEVLDYLQASGRQNVLLVGGSQINALFLDAGLADELYLTIEPTIFGDGLMLTAPLRTSVALQLLDQKLLNDRGTMLLHYQILKSRKDD